MASVGGGLSVLNTTTAPGSYGPATWGGSQTRVFVTLTVGPNEYIEILNFRFRSLLASVDANAITGTMIVTYPSYSDTITLSMGTGAFNYTGDNLTSSPSIPLPKKFGPGTVITFGANGTANTFNVQYRVDVDYIRFGG
jgi:hypothetical protein